MKSSLETLFIDFKIKNICSDSRKAQSGDVFFFIKKDKDSDVVIRFISNALENGANLVITDDKIAVNYLQSNRVIYLEDASQALYVAADIVYPKLPKYLLAITGTNGKTSVASYCRQLFALLGCQSASIGTLGVNCNNSFVRYLVEQYLSDDSNLTTPDFITLRHILHDLASNEVDYVAFEASSHGLDQDRLGNIKAFAGAFTSFSQDHFDYHKTKENYLSAKLKLFSEYLVPRASAIISSEIEEIDYISEFLAKHDIETKTIGSVGDIIIRRDVQSLYGQIINFSYSDTEYNFQTEIIGKFQASNLLIAALLVNQTGFDFNRIVSLLPYVKAEKGRLQRITDINCPSQVFIDYAHTPDALSRTLAELKKILPIFGRLKVVFGCGGDRDRTKRPMMGKIACKFADEVIITDDNPRTEDPVQIRKDILSDVFLSTRFVISEIADRKEAIFSAINGLNNGDILLIAGKGHEEYQILGATKMPFSDYEVVMKALGEKYDLVR